MKDTKGFKPRFHRKQKKQWRKRLDVRISRESETAITVRYRDSRIHGQRVDLIVRKLIVVELKAVKRFDDVHRSQLISSLKTTGLRAAC
jgi:GxxExxY protein